MRPPLALSTTRTTVLLTAIAAALTLWCAAGSSTAHAAPPAQASALCTDAPHGCGVTVAAFAREGATVPVVVHGRPGTRVTLMAYQAIIDDQGQLAELTPLGAGQEVLTNSFGAVSVEFTIPAVVTHESSGWALISVDGLSSTDTSMTVGTFVPFGARRPKILGDGYASDKPVGEVIEVQAVGAISGSRFVVEYQANDGQWHDITVGEAHASGSPAEPFTIAYQLPRGLTDEPHQLRLSNVTDSAISSVWLATPSADGQVADVKPVFTPPPVGDALDGTSVLAAHPTEQVRLASYVIGGASALYVAVVTVVSRRRDS